jgi:hypothetical protein
VGKYLGKIYLEDQEVEGRITIRWILGRWAVRMGLKWLRTVSIDAFWLSVMSNFSVLLPEI